MQKKKNRIHTYTPALSPVWSNLFITFRLSGSLPQEFLASLAAWHESEKKRIAVETKGEEQESAKILLQKVQVIGM